MNTELQNKVWQVLPKEFKEEVKEYYDNSSVLRAKAVLLLENLFGIDNLTSDAEGEETLTVPRSKVTELFRKFRKNGSNACLYAAATLDALFGSKCLPDTPSDNVDSLADNVDSLEQKQNQPEFKPGDKVRYALDRRIYEIDGKTGREHYHLKGLQTDVHVDDLEPYTEPIEKSANLSQNISNCDKQFDKILNHSFSRHNRLHIAAMAMQGLLANPEHYKEMGFDDYFNGDSLDKPWNAIARQALFFADALIAEAEKGGAE